MKIAFVAPFGLGQKTTVWARTLPLAKELVKLGHTVRILIPPWDTPADSGKSWSDEGVELINVTLGGGLPFTTLRLLQEIRKFQPQIIHIVKPRAHAGIVQWLVWQMKRLQIADWRLRPISTLFVDLDDWEQAWDEINHYPRLVAKFLAWQEEWGIRHADGITVASRWLEARAHQYAPATPILYLPNGVNVNEAPGQQVEVQQGNPQSKILYLTRYVEVDPQWLTRFSSSLHEKLPGTQIIIAGEPLQPGRDQLFRAALKQSLAKVSFLGKVTPAQIAELYRQVDCAIFPATPTVLQQAKCSVRLATTLLHGVPVVASAVGEQAHYGAAGAARLVAAAATPELFAEAVVELLTDPQQQRVMIERARQHLLQNYRWERLGQQLDRWYPRFGAAEKAKRLSKKAR